MPMESSPFVKINYFNREAVEKVLKDYVRELYSEHPDVEKVVIFGSFVRNDSVPGSDLDILIILKKSNIRFLDRIPLYMPSHFPIGVDVFPYTKEEMKKMVSEGNFFLKRALEEGKEIR